MTAPVSPTPRVREVAGARVPDFFIVGHPKCGTTALYDMLRHHPELFLPDRKEPSYFTREFENRNRPQTLEEYLSLFAGASPEQRAGEASPSYLWSPTAARRIGELQPDARIIAIFREPASYLRSLHMQYLRINAETEKDLRKALALEPARREGRELPPNSTRPAWLLYSEQLRYVEQLRRFHEVFGREQVLVLIYEDYRADNAGTVREVLRFLGVDDSVRIDPLEANPARRVRSPRLRALVRALYLGRGPVSGAVKSSIKALTPQRLRYRAIAAENRTQLARPREADEQLLLELRRRFKHEVEALGEYLDRDLVARWGYDRLG